MKNKMLARRIAIAMLSAATVMTAAPVGAFAATVSVAPSAANAEATDDYEASTKTFTSSTSALGTGTLDQLMLKAAQVLENKYYTAGGNTASYTLADGYANTNLDSDITTAFGTVTGGSVTVTSHPEDVTVETGASKKTVKGKVTVTITNGTDTVTGVYNVEFDANLPAASTLKTAQRLDVVANALQKYLNGYNGFNGTTTYTTNDLKNIVNAYLTTTGANAGFYDHSSSPVAGKLSDEYLDAGLTAAQKGTGAANEHTNTALQVTDITVSTDDTKTYNSTTATQGKVSGTVTLKFDAIKADTAAASKTDAQDAATKTIEFSATRQFADATLSQKTVSTVVKYIETKSYPNDVTPQDIADDVNAKLKDWAKNTSNLTNTELGFSPVAADDDVTPSHFDGLTVTVGELQKVLKQTHDKSVAGTDGSFATTVTVSDGKTNRTGDVARGKLIHSTNEKLTELDTALTASAKNYQDKYITRIQSKNAVNASEVSAVIGTYDGTHSTPAAGTTVGALTSNATGVYKIIYDALKTKPEGAQKDFITATADIASATPLTVIEVPKNTTPSKFAADTTPKAAGITAVVSLDKATSEKEGTATVVVTSALQKENTAAPNAEFVQKTTTFTLTLPKLKAKADTYLSFNKDAVTWKYYAKGNDYADRGNEYGDAVTDYKEANNITETGKNENTDADNTYALTLASPNNILTRNGNDVLNWTSSDPSVASVDSEGVVTLKSLGTATITVTSNSNPSLSASITVNSSENYKFTDVQNKNDYYFNHVYSAVSAGWVAGTSADTFSPADPVTRAQFVTFLYREAGSPAVSTTTKFTDVANLSTETQKAIAWASQQGIAYGTTNTAFEPNKTVNRAQAVAFLYRAKGNGDNYNGTASSAFVDVKSGDYFEDAVNWAVYRNITAGKDATHFAPTDECNRAQAVTFIDRALGNND